VVRPVRPLGIREHRRVVAGRPVVRVGVLLLEQALPYVGAQLYSAPGNELHSGADEVSAFTDVGDDEIAVYVRDRGTGFDPDELSPDSHGIADSIRGRMERVGGTAAIGSSAEGTEVELRLGRQS